MHAGLGPSAGPTLDLFEGHHRTPLPLSMLARRGSRATAVAAVACTMLALFMWRIELGKPVPLPRAGDAATLVLPTGLPHLDDVLLARTSGDPFIAYFGSAQFHTGGKSYENTTDFKLFLWGDSLMMLPLRALPNGPGTIDLGRLGPSFDPAVPAAMAKQRLVWGPPCWFWPGRAACRTKFLFPPARLPLGELVGLGSAGLGSAGRADDYILGGWSVPDPNARWTDGGRASLRFGLPGTLPAGDLVLEMTAHRFSTPGDDAPSHATVRVNGRTVATWRLGRDSPGVFRAPLPRDAVGPDGAVVVDLVIGNPRQPWHSIGSPDVRDLGLFVESMKLVSLPPP